MGNKFQRLIYNTSILAPLIFVIAIVWYHQMRTIFVSIMLIIVGTILAVLLYVSFGYATKNVEKIPFRAAELEPKDGWLIAYIIAYIIPLGSIVISDYNVLATGAVAVILIAIVSLININTAIPHPLLFILGYHFYSVKSETGVSDYILISKRKALRNTKHIKSVRRLFEYLLIEA